MKLILLIVILFILYKFKTKVFVKLFRTGKRYKARYYNELLLTYHNSYLELQGKVNMDSRNLAYNLLLNLALMSGDPFYRIKLSSSQSRKIHSLLNHYKARQHTRETLSLADTDMTMEFVDMFHGGRRTYEYQQKLITHLTNNL